MKGHLTEQPLVELIREISSKGLSGTLRLEHARAKFAVYFEEGQIVFAASNLRTLRLRAYLETRTAVTKEELARLGSKPSDLRLVAALRTNGVLAGEQVDALLALAVSDVLRVVLLWMEGDWEFDERARLDESARVNVNVSNLLREAARRMPLSFVSSRFCNPREIFTRATKVSKIKNLLPEESFILSRLDSPMSLGDLVAVSGLPAVETHRILYGLTLSGLVSREFWQNAFRGVAAKIPKEQTGESALITSAFEKPEEDVDLDQFLQRASKAADYYELLDMPVTADASEIKVAYYTFARRYHPDRFHLKSGTALHGKLGSAFARLTQAYQTLTNPSARAGYDRALERTKQLQMSAAGQPDASSAGDDGVDAEVSEGNPEYNYREGLAALRDGQINAAISYLAAAAHAAPEEARYRAYYGKALAGSDRTRRLAEVEIQAAVKLDPTRASYRAMLAELYFDLQFHVRAQAELERALSLDPNNAAAQSVERKMQKSRKTG